MEKINIYRKKLRKTNEIELKQDLIVPDSKQDLFQIIDGNFYCYFSKIEIENGKITLSGNVDSYISYISSNEETLGLQASFNLNDVLENNNINDEMNVEYNIKVAKYDIKIINERKISLTINLKITYELYGSDTIEILNDFSEIEDVQLNSKTIKLNSLIGINSNIASLKEELKVNGTDIISDILKVDTNISNKEVKISYNKVLSKADLMVKILYLTKDGRIEKAEENFPLMSFIDLENIKEENICSTCYQVRNILLKIDNDENLITIQMEYEIICKAFEVKEQEVVSDLYSLKYDTELDKKEFEIIDDISTKSDKSVDINEKIELESVRKIIDVFGKSKILKNNISKDISNLEGEVELKVYYESETKIGLNIKTVTIPFIAKIDSQEEILTEFENLEYDLNENVLIVKGKVVIYEDEVKKNKINVVQKVTKKELTNSDDYSMVVYSIKKNDTLWDISKKFRVKKENIITLNELEEPYNLKFGEKMYIIR